MKPKNINDYQPSYGGYGKDYGKVFYYDRSWYCVENYSIHTSEKATLNCTSCSKIWYKN